MYSDFIFGTVIVSRWSGESINAGWFKLLNRGAADRNSRPGKRLGVDRIESPDPASSIAAAAVTAVAMTSDMTVDRYSVRIRIKFGADPTQTSPPGVE